LISEAQKYRPRVFFFDQFRGSEIFIKSIRGNYKRILKDSSKSQLRMNPLQLPDDSYNRAFIKAWMQYLIMDDSYAVAPADSALIDQAIEYTYTLPQEQRMLSVVAPRFWSSEDAPAAAPVEAAPVEGFDAEIAALKEGGMPPPTASAVLDAAGAPPQKELTPGQRMARWFGDGEWAHFFDNQYDELNFDRPVNGFDMTDSAKTRPLLAAVLSYLFHRVRLTLDGTPTIIVLDEAWSLVDNPIFAPMIPSWLDDLRQNNAMVIFATESVKDAAESDITRPIAEKVGTHIFLPNPEATEAYQEVFGLNENEYALLEDMNGVNREFLLKHHGDAVIATLDLAGLDDIIGVFSGTKENVALVENIMLDTGEDPAYWLPVFMEKLRDAATKK
jgi:type IV secretion system protein VirB4